MAVTLRLTRVGGKKLPFYRLVAADRRSPRGGRFIEQLGIYDPLRDPPEVRIDHDRLHYWLGVGALPSDTVGEIIRKLNRNNAFEGHPIKELLARRSAPVKKGAKSASRPAAPAAVRT